MPTEEENLQYLYLVLTAGGAPTIDFASISKTLTLSTGAVSKRWSRLRQAMDGGKNPGPTAYEFLWLCVKHNTRDKAMDWADIAKKCGTTPGAASKRYSRMKQAFDRGDAAPATPSKSKNASNGTTSSANGTTSTPKRKRATATTSKKKAVGDEEKFQPDTEEDAEDEYAEKKPKRTKSVNASKPRTIPKPKLKGKQTPAIKEEPDQSAGFLIHNSNGSGNGHSDSYYARKHLPTPTLSGSVNPTEATTLIKTDPDDPHTSMQGLLYDAVVDDGGEQFYDANEVLGEDEETFPQERVHEWLEHQEAEEI